MSARCQLVFCPLLHSSLLLVSDTLNISVVIVTSMELLFRLNLKCQFNICLFIPINSMYSCKNVISILGGATLCHLTFYRTFDMIQTTGGNQPQPQCLLFERCVYYCILIVCALTRAPLLCRRTDAPK